MPVENQGLGMWTRPASNSAYSNRTARQQMVQLSLAKHTTRWSRQSRRKEPIVFGGPFHTPLRRSNPIAVRRRLISSVLPLW
jgi:hypothetical protein